MNAIGLLCAVMSGGAVSFLPLLSWLQGEGLARQTWVIILGHLLALPVLVMLAVSGGWAWPGATFLAVAAVAGMCSGINGTLYYAGVMHRGPMAISWAIVWLGAVVVAVAGWIFLGEPIYAAQPIAVLCFVACLVVMGRASDRASRSAGRAQPIRPGYWAMLFTAMAVGVAGTMLVKIHPQGGSDMTFTSAYVAGLATVLLIFTAGGRIKPTLDRRTLLVSVLWGAAVTPLYIGIVWGFRVADVSVFTPTYSGIALFLGVMWAAIRGERPGRLVYLGAALALLSIVLINLRGPVLARL